MNRSTSNPSQGHLAPLDGVRALAITLVVVYHVVDKPLELPTGLLQHVLGFGWAGVPLFFVLSGFLVGGRLFAQLRDGTFRPGRFYVDRSFRILPVAFAYLVFYGWKKGLLGWNSWTLANFTYVSQQLGIETPQHFWSLQIEEQFYALAPLALALLVGYLRRGQGDVTARFQRFLTYAIPAAWVLRGLSALYSHAPTYEPYRDGLNYLEFFFVGVLVHTWVHGPQARTIRAAVAGLPAWAPLALALGAYVPLTLMEPWHSRSCIGVQHWGQILVYPWLAAWAGAVVLFAALADTGTNPVARVLASKPAHVVAVLSYSIYIWHHDVLIGLDFSTEIPLWAQLVLWAAAISVSTLASYYLFEVPFLFLRDLTRNALARRRDESLSVQGMPPVTGAETAVRTKGSLEIVAERSSPTVTTANTLAA